MNTQVKQLVGEIEKMKLATNFQGYSDPPKELRALDLRDEVAALSNYAAGQFCIVEDDRCHNTVAEYLFDIDSMRLGIAWGGDATWADACDLSSGVAMWLNYPELWEARN